LIALRALKGHTAYMDSFSEAQFHVLVNASHGLLTQTRRDNVPNCVI
jgi:hypothetical protein